MRRWPTGILLAAFVAASTGCNLLFAGPSDSGFMVVGEMAPECSCIVAAFVPDGRCMAGTKVTGTYFERTLVFAAIDFPIKPIHVRILCNHGIAADSVIQLEYSATMQVVDFGMVRCPSCPSEADVGEGSR
jgi:hypothetical protein